MNGLTYSLSIANHPNGFVFELCLLDGHQLETAF